MIGKKTRRFFIILFLTISFSVFCETRPAASTGPRPDIPVSPTPRGKTTTSAYDALFQRIAAEEGLDWRLLSAIAYNESRHRNDLVSFRGARGMMQIMPATAQALGADEESLMNPEVNIRLGARLVRRIERSLRFGPGTSAADRQALTLAAYNGGIGHVLDARRLAVKYGADPDSWTDVSHYLRLKAQPEWAADEVVRCGEFNGAAETIGFVRHVSRQYLAYSAL